MEDLHRQRNITLVLVTHDPALAAKAQRQVVLRDGMVISDEVNL
jgi:putative ABC transport system ATP-binding protein